MGGEEFFIETRRRPPVGWAKPLGILLPSAVTVAVVLISRQISVDTVSVSILGAVVAGLLLLLAKDRRWRRFGSGVLIGALVSFILSVIVMSLLLLVLANTPIPF